MSRVSLSNQANSLRSIALSLATLTTSISAQPANTILLEKWDNITGTAVSALTGNANYPNTPTTRTYPTIYEITTNGGDNYGTRTRGYITAPTTGNYTFWIAGDDDCELWLGTSESPSTITRIAYVTGWTNSREWTKFTTQQSAVLALTAGQRYYVETRHKEGTGGDNLAVGWQLPSGTQERPIPGTRLSPFLLATAPTITTQPSAQTVNVGQTATFSVVASGTAPLTYQWRRDGSNISGATSSSYTTPATVVADMGAVFSVMVTNSGGSVTSANATLTLRLPPTIVTQPTSQTVNLGQTATFSVAASGTAPLTYQWRRNGSNISGATSASYTTPTTVVADTGTVFSVVVTNVVSSATSANAVLVVRLPPTIVTQPTNQTVTVGQAATFSVMASGTAPLTYQWRRNGSNISGATTSSYTLSSTVAGDNGASFNVVVSNAAGNGTSANCTLTVNLALTPPTITTQPQSLTVTEGQSATFTVVGTGNPAPTYQWRRGGVNITNAISSSYAIPVAAMSDSGAVFSVMLTNSQGTSTSNNAVLVVNRPLVAPTITTQPVSVTVQAGASASFSVVGTGNPLPTYQWRRNGSDIPGASSASYALPVTSPSDSGAQFSVRLTNSQGNISSANAILTVLPALAMPTINLQPVSRTVLSSRPATFEVGALGNPAPSFQWRRNGADIPGATSAIYTLPIATLGDSGAVFRVRVYNTQGEVQSNGATLSVIEYNPLPKREQIAVSGELRDGAGNLIGRGTQVLRSMTLRIFPSMTGGVSLYSEDFLSENDQAVPILDGRFTTYLGSGIASNTLSSVLSQGSDLYLEIAIGEPGGQETLSPRTPWTSPGLAGTASVFRGNGIPTQAAPPGAYYQDDNDGSTWVRMPSNWVRISP